MFDIFIITNIIDNIL